MCTCSIQFGQRCIPSESSNHMQCLLIGLLTSCEVGVVVTINASSRRVTMYSPFVKFAAVRSS